MSVPPDPPENRPNPSETPAPVQIAEFQKVLEDWQQGSGKGNAEQEEAIGIRLLTLATEIAEKNPTPNDEWHKRIAAIEDNFGWEKSIALRREHIAWKRTNDPVTLWKNLTDLSRLLWMCGRRIEAAAIAEEAVLCAKESGIFFAPLMTMPVAARYAAALGRIEDAERMVEEAMAGAESAEERRHEMTGRLTLSLRLCRARLALGRGDLLLAQRQLDEIQPEIERYADSPILAGLRSRHAEHAELSGQLHFARGESTAAIEAFERATHHRQAVLQMPQIAERHFVQYAMARTLLLMAEALEPTQPEAADDRRRRASELFDFLRLPPGPTD